jgi:hypothetical protein
MGVFRVLQESQVGFSVAGCNQARERMAADFVDEQE